ncbi:uncharacterized protein BKA55DRAFT_352203 [Fusarium redolens]|jgi:hypothetical protein|uniref:Uncharacterized protein n=1 Tax=Fusarium redolens TaxID=48865 RepID=A0A9P9HBG7_FUSRE|nr:uncharacterized protein BKA55DRAFT_352203 [Fusarium redolens]KAH7254042.1 hypothetical protein BKA55DRAFT_352203 [Fusarium redolens]
MSCVLFCFALLYFATSLVEKCPVALPCHLFHPTSTTNIIGVNTDGLSPPVPTIYLSIASSSPIQFISTFITITLQLAENTLATVEIAPARSRDTRALFHHILYRLGPTNHAIAPRFDPLEDAKSSACHSTPECPFRASLSGRSYLKWPEFHTRYLLSDSYQPVDLS